MGKKEQEEENPVHYELRTISNKLKGMGYMLEGLGRIDSSRLDAEDVYLGIGIILNEIGERVYEISTKLDEQEIKNHKN